MTASIEEINKSLDYAAKFFSGDYKKMNEETESIEKQIAELAEAYLQKTGISIIKIGIFWPYLPTETTEKKVIAVTINVQTDII